MAASAAESQIVGNTCKDCSCADHLWEESRVKNFSCLNPKKSAPNNIDELKRIIGSSFICPLKRIYN